MFAGVDSRNNHYIKNRIEMFSIILIILFLLILVATGIGLSAAIKEDSFDCPIHLDETESFYHQ